MNNSNTYQQEVEMGYPEFKSRKIEFHSTSYGATSERDCGVSVLTAFECDAPHNRLSAREIKHVLIDDGREVEELHRDVNSDLRLSEFLKYWVDVGYDYYMLALRGKGEAHSMAVVNGKMVDTNFCHGNTLVHLVYRVSKK